MTADAFIIQGRTLELVQGDITNQDVDAIVNAANSSLVPGGGVDGAIHRAGGPAIAKETADRYPGGCPAGSAVITTGGSMKAKHVIHAVGPIWHGGARGEDQVLSDAYCSALQAAKENQLKSIAFPSVSTGAYRYPVDRAAATALQTIVDHLRGETSLTPFRFVLFDESTYRSYNRALEQVAGASTQTS